MNAYEIVVWRSVKHNNGFSHNDGRVVLVHARNEEEAKKKVVLRVGCVIRLIDLIIDVSAEFIYSTRKIGTVRIERFYVYSDGRSPVLIDK